MKKLKLLLSLAIAISAIVALTVSASASYKVSSWAEEAIGTAVGAGLIDRNDYLTDYTAPITRRDIAELLYDAYLNASDNYPYSGDFSFSDVDYYDYKISAIANLGIMTGTGPDTFSPDKYTTRQEMAKIITTFKAVLNEEELSLYDNDVSNFADSSTISDWARPYVNLASSQGILQGYENGTFRPTVNVSREQAISLVVRSANLKGSPQPRITSHYQEQVIKTKDTMNFTFSEPGNYTLYAVKTLPTTSYTYMKELGRCTESNIIPVYPYSFETCAIYYVFAERDGVFTKPVMIYTDSKIVVTSEDYFEPGLITVSWQPFRGMANSTVTVTEKRMTPHGESHLAENTPRKISIPSGNAVTFTGHPNKKYTVVISSTGFTAKKEIYTSGVYNDTSAIYNSWPENKDAAKKLMTTVTVPIWKLNSKGQKYSSKASITVHHLIADKVKLVFQEIYNGPEKFPIKDIGGFSWRNSSTSEHNCGTAIDINSNENYCIYSNGTVVGSFWKPGESPYSIKPYGDVVRAFEKYGFNWGGDSWSSTRDYMHFSYMGT